MMPFIPFLPQLTGSSGQTGTTVPLPNPDSLLKQKHAPWRFILNRLPLSRYGWRSLLLRLAVCFLILDTLVRRIFTVGPRSRCSCGHGVFALCLLLYILPAMPCGTYRPGRTHTVTGRQTAQANTCFFPAYDKWFWPVPFRWDHGPG